MATRQLTGIGERFHRLIVIKEVPRKGREREVLARCDCGKETIVVLQNLRSGHTKSCGCMKKESGSSHITHGYTRKGRCDGTYSCYRDMRTRCENPNYREFHLYGGRGIAVCEHWRDSFENFLADMGPRPKGMTIERIDVNSGYSPQNCKWASIIAQANNKRSNVLITYQGRTQTIAQWVRELGIPEKRAYWRASRGWADEQVLFGK